jgi:excisionase family DNA binding protein
MLSREGQSLEQGQYLLTASEAAEYLRVSLATLHRMEKKGQLVPYRTLGGHRRYSLTMKMISWSAAGIDTCPEHPRRSITSEHSVSR